MNIARIEDRLVVASEPTGLSIYDFDFDVNFAAAHPAAFRDGERVQRRAGVRLRRHSATGALAARAGLARRRRRCWSAHATTPVLNSRRMVE